MMKGNITSSFFILIFSFAAFAQSAPGAKFVENSIYFKLKVSQPAPGGIYAGNSINNTTPQTQFILPLYLKILNENKVTSIYNPFTLGGERTKSTYRADFPPSSDLDQIIQDLINSGSVEYAERIPVYRICAAPSDPSTSTDFSIKYFSQIKMNSSWDYQFRSATPVVIAVIDVSIRTGHEDLIENLWVNPRETPGDGVDNDTNGFVDDMHGVDYGDMDINTDPGPIPFIPDNEKRKNYLEASNHGTHVAGIACATTNNTLGIPSLGFNAKLMAIKATPDNNAEYDFINKGIEGIYYAVKSGANIINISWGTDVESSPLNDAIDYAIGKGVIVIAGAGNFGNDSKFYPAACPGVIAVGASYIDRDNRWVDVGYGSNFGDYIDVMAPGAGIYSCYAFANSTPSSNTYGYLSGTSMASPLVAGLASLILSQNPTLTPEQVKNCLKNGCDPIDDPDFRNKLLGAGRINVDKTMGLLMSTGRVNPKNEGINIYPNPSNGTFFISFQGGDTHKYTVSVSDLQGREVFTETGSKTAEDLQIQIPEMEKGLYIVRLQTGDQSLMVQRIAVY